MSKSKGDWKTFFIYANKGDKFHVDGFNLKFAEVSLDVESKKHMEIQIRFRTWRKKPNE